MTGEKARTVIHSTSARSIMSTESKLDRSFGSRSPLTLAFRDPAFEHAFQVEVAAVNAPHGRMGALASVALWAFADVLARLTTSLAASGVLDIVCFGMAFMNALGLALSIVWGKTTNQQQVIGLALNGLAGLAVLFLLRVSGAGEPLAAPAILLIAMFAFVGVRLRFVFALSAAGTYVLGFAIIFISRHGSVSALEIFLVAGAIGIGLAGTYQLERGARDVYAQRRLIEEQSAALREARADSDRLLLNVLPESIADRLKRGEKTIVDAFDDTTVLFADLVGFTPLAARLTPRATLELLDRLFTGFDELAARHGLEKIKTIGDAYMVVGGIPQPSNGSSGARR